MNISQHWAAFTAAPHRVMFFGGVVQAIAVMLWWLVELATRSGIAGSPVDWPLMPVAIHGWLMIYGLFPMFMFGFLMTTFPRWMNGREIPAGRYVPAFVLLMLGIACFYAGLLVGHAMLLVATFIMLAGWGVALYALLRALLDTTHPDKRHPMVLFVALCMGWCGLAAYAVWLASDATVWLQIALHGGLWFFLLPVFTTVAHRMIPFFTSSALQFVELERPDWPWKIMLAGSAAHGLLQLAGADGWRWLADVPLAVAALYLTHAWRLRRTLGIPLLAVLHIGFAWIGIAMLLFAVQSLALLATGMHIGGLAPLHALTLGCFATLLIGMVTRVTLGHSGKPMRIDGKVKLMFAGMQLVALLRVLADVLPAQIGYGMYFAAAIIWLACFATWALRYLPMFWKLRADGRPG